jgi:hypothetical protein
VAIPPPYLDFLLELEIMEQVSDFMMVIVNQEIKPHFQLVEHLMQVILVKHHQVTE